MGNGLVRTAFSSGERGEPVIARSGVPVWSIVGYLKLFQWDIAKVIDEFEGILTVEEVAAASECYKQHPQEIDRKILSNQSAE